MKRLLSLIFVLLAAPALAGVSWTTEGPYTVAGKATWKHIAAVTSAADGTASDSTTMHGYVVRMVTQPGSGVSAATYKLYDANPTDLTKATDVLGGVSARSTTAAETAYPLDQNGSAIFARVDGVVYLSVSGLGNAKTSTVVFYVQE